MRWRARVLAAAVLCAGASAAADRLGDFAYGARQRFESKIAAVLNRSGAPSVVSGTVTFSKDDFFFIQDGEEALKIVRAPGVSRPVPPAGSVVEVTGQPALEGGRVVMASRAWRTTASGPLPPAVTAAADNLVFAGERPVDRSRDINWRRVSATGRVMGSTENGFSLDVGDGLLVSVTIPRLPPFLDDCEQLHPRVTVKAVAELFLDQSALFGRGRYVIGVRLCAVSPSDVALLSDIGYELRRRARTVAIVSYSLIALLAVGLLVLSSVVLRNRRIRYSTAMVMADRKRMADDLHDTIEQHLAGAGMLLKLARLPVNALTPGAERPVREAQDILLRAKQEMRDIVWGLKNDDMMRQTPVNMLRTVAAEQAKKGLFRIRTRLTGLPEKLEGGAMRDLSLIVREAIGNAVKHGQARKIAVTADPREGGGWVLRVANDGTPFDAATALGPAQGHFGLEGMKERARRIGAELSISRKGKWTIVVLTR
jgi:signal transduction histidine kinase